MKKKIFIVDDEMISSLSFQRVLEKNGYQVELYNSGEGCLETLDEGAEPDLILMDINLGPDRMDGSETTRRIYEKYDVPVVLHSAYNVKETIDSTRNMTKYGYILKVPGNEQVLLASLEMALQLYTSEKKYRDLSIHLQNVREEQNAAIAREIHDDLGQSMTALKMNLTFLERNLAELGVESEEIGETLTDMRFILDGTINRIREIARVLRPAVLDTSGLIEALEWQVKEFQNYSGLNTRFRNTIDEIEMGNERSLNIFRIVQEALTNCARHSGATEVSVTVTMEQGELKISIRDNGSGFKDAERRNKNSFGLVGMKERAIQCGGSLIFDDTPGAGLEVRLAVPVEGKI